jgi:hypothetical protein
VPDDPRSIWRLPRGKWQLLRGMDQLPGSLRQIQRWKCGVLRSEVNSCAAFDPCRAAKAIAARDGPFARQHEANPTLEMRVAAQQSQFLRRIRPLPRGKGNCCVGWAICRAA